MKKIFFLAIAAALLICPANPAIAAQVGGETNDLAQAREAMAQGDTRRALDIYDRLAAENPGDAELILEAARAHRSAGNEVRAAALGRQVLDEYEKRRFRMQGVLRTGVLYDSNANQGPSSGSIRLGDWNVILRGSEKQPSGGAYISGSIDLSRRLEAWVVNTFPDRKLSS